VYTIATFPNKAFVRMWGAGSSAMIDNAPLFVIEEKVVIR
jgi:hypothetical protein